MFSVSFFCHIVSYWEKIFSNLIRNVVAILPLKSKLSRKFQRFNAVNRDIQMQKIVKFSKISIQIKNCKIFCKVQTVNRLQKFIQSPPIPPTPEKTLLRLGNKIFFREIYGNIQTLVFKELQECSSWVSRNVVVQIFFLTPHRNIFAENL